jgi:putative FmdB family regulatory protein
MAMPIYEYECTECGVLFDMRQSVGAPPPPTCPAGHRAVRRRLSAPAIIFKGSGFYVTDHGRNGRSATATAGRARHEAAGEKGGEADAGAGKAETKEQPGSKESID